MTTLTISVEDASIVPSLRRVLRSINGVSIVRSSDGKTKRMSNYEKAMDDIKCGRVTTYKNSQELFDELGI